MIDVGKYSIDSTHSGMCLFLLRFFIPICSPIPTPFSSIPQWSFLLCFGGQETNAILFDAFDLIRSARPTASSDFAVFQCESFDQDVTEGVSKIHVLFGGGVGLGEQGWRVLCVCIMENPQPSFFVVLHLLYIIILYLIFMVLGSKGLFRVQVGTRSFGDVMSPQNIWGTEIICQFEGEKLARKIGKFNVDGSCKKSWSEMSSRCWASTTRTQPIW